MNQNYDILNIFLLFAYIFIKAAVPILHDPKQYNILTGFSDCIQKDEMAHFGHFPDKVKIVPLVQYEVMVTAATQQSRYMLWVTFGNMSSCSKH